jgi:hypothetical protein
MRICLMLIYKKRTWREPILKARSSSRQTSVARLTRAELQAASFDEATLTAADLSGASLAWTSFFSAAATGADFRSATYSHTIFYMTNLHHGDEVLQAAKLQDLLGAVTDMSQSGCPSCGVSRTPPDRRRHSYRRWIVCLVIRRPWSLVRSLIEGSGFDRSASSAQRWAYCS